MAATLQKQILLEKLPQYLESLYEEAQRNIQSPEDEYRSIKIYEISDLGVRLLIEMYAKWPNYFSCRGPASKNTQLIASILPADKNSVKGAYSDRIKEVIKNHFVTSFSPTLVAYSGPEGDFIADEETPDLNEKLNLPKETWYSSRLSNIVINGEQIIPAKRR
ncbi:MAG: hypothetical protein H7A37_08845 [Chlamydiales bacterium]|nr:hypothetical protein [Chlamydiia bacterium]MCP5508387.1 hypothetical protein [Chlamydiales bacterium]